MLVAASIAQVPNTFHFQGAIKDSDGVPVNDTKFIEFKLFDVETGGVALWSEGPVSVQIIDGLFSFELGSVDAFPPELFESGPLYITFDMGAGDMEPRQKLVSVPFALNAASNDGSWDSNGDILVNLTQSVGIGTDDPQTKLEVNALIRLTPSSMDGACDFNLEGSIYYDEHLSEFCYCDGEYWIQMDGGGYCDCVDMDGDGVDICNPSHVYDTDGLAADCDDGNVSVYPGNIEYCDGIDNDCDPLTTDGSDEPAIGATCDGGDLDLCEEGTTICLSGTLMCSDLSDDNIDICDGQDNDCDYNTADGSGDPSVGGPCDGPDADLCEEGIRYCADGLLVCAEEPGDNLEYCNGLDDDCDGEFDEDAVDGSTYYLDSDGDGYGDDNISVISCYPQPSYVSVSGDCNDDDPTVYPGATELCDGLDNDCVGGLLPGEVDTDGDGYVPCTFDAGGWDGDFVVIGGDDCDDDDNSVYPGAPELCDDGIDNDCDGDIDGDDTDCEGVCTINGAACDDGDLCTTNDICQDGLCIGTPVSCEDGNYCTDDLCDSETGECTYVNNTNACNDGSPCTVNDACVNGNCLGTPMDCDDGNSCTTDYCDDGNCIHLTDDSFCDDGSANTFDYCDGVSGCYYVTNYPPVADYTANPQPGSPGEDITFDASGSYDPDSGEGDYITLYEWDWDDDGVFDDSFVVSTSTTHQFPAEGNYPVALRVTDSQGLQNTLYLDILIISN